MTAPFRYDRIPFVYPDAVDPWNYAGNNRLAPCRTIRIGDVDLRLPPELIGKPIRVKIVVEEDRA